MVDVVNLEIAGLSR